MDTRRCSCSLTIPGFLASCPACGTTPPPPHIAPPSSPPSSVFAAITRDVATPGKVRAIAGGGPFYGWLARSLMPATHAKGGK
jgi:hypothetical protein